MSQHFEKLGSSQNNNNDSIEKSKNNIIPGDKNTRSILNDKNQQSNISKPKNTLNSNDTRTINNILDLSSSENNAPTAVSSPVVQEIGPLQVAAIGKHKDNTMKMDAINQYKNHIAPVNNSSNISSSTSGSSSISGDSKSTVSRNAEDVDSKKVDEVHHYFML